MPLEQTNRQRAIDSLIELNRALSDVWEPTSAHEAAQLLATHVGAVRVLLSLVDDDERTR
jgi:hypothetical protein